MRLRRIEIAQFRKLAGPVVLDGLGDGLIVVSGDNEEGKSTVLAALKAAFFEHHTVGGAVREAMAPHAGGVPEIAVEFECGGERHMLRKAFRRAGAMLESGGSRHQDDAAERRLQELLRFERRQARSPRPENSGIQALFWVDQATAFRDFDGIAGGRERLTAAISAEIGTVAGGGMARRLLATARERAAGYVTAGRQQETGALKAAGERLRELEAEHAEVERRRVEFEGRVDRLARHRADRARLIEQDQAGRARGRREAVHRGLAELTALEQRCRMAVEAVKAAAAEEARLAAQHRMRGELSAEVLGLESTLHALGARIDAAGREALVLRQGFEAGQASEAAAVTLAEAADRTATTARDAVAAARSGAEAARLGQALARCRVARELVLGTQAMLAADPVTPERVTEARALQQAAEQAAVLLATVATRLDFRPLPGQTVRVEGREVDPAQPFMAGERVELELLGFGRVVVTPGGEDLAARRAAVVAARGAYDEALGALGCGSLAEAEAALERRRAAETEQRRAEAELAATLQASAVRSLDALARLCAEREAELDRLRGRLPPELDLSDERALAQAAVDASEGADRARADLEQSRQIAAEAIRRLADAEAALAGLHGERQGSERRLPELRARLTAERAVQDDAALQGAFRGATETRASAELIHDRLGRELAAGDAEGLRERLAIAERELAALENERRRLDAEIRDLEVALREAGGDSWVERLAELPSALESARATHHRLELEGRAWRLLADRLAAADQSVRETLLAPVAQRLRPLLQRVFPGAEPVIDPDSLGLTHLSRDGAQESFDSLSIGAREQVAVLVRLAFASLLAEREGEAPCLILDDALVYADETRFATMKTILQRAAREMQILVLTCRPRDYFGLEAHYLRLEDCRSG